MIDESITVLGFIGTKKGMSIKQQDALRKYAVGLGDVEVHHGGNIGADTRAHFILKNMPNVKKIFIHPPSSRKLISHCLKFNAGCEVIVLPRLSNKKRNKEIIDACTVVIGAPMDRVALYDGVWTAIRYACARGKRVIFLDEKGFLSNYVTDIDR